MKPKTLLMLVLGLCFSAQMARADWSAAKRLTWNPGYSRFAAIAVDSNDTIHLVWSDYLSDNNDLYYKSSTDGGASWSLSRRLSWTSGVSYDAAIALDSGNKIHLVWYDTTPGNYEIYYTKSTNGGSDWSANKRLSWTSLSSYLPVIAVDSSPTIHVVWQDFTPGNCQLLYKRSTDEGATWSAAQRLTWTSGQSYDPVIAIDPSDTVHIVWTNETPGNGEIYYKRSTDGGLNWGPAKRLTWTSGFSEFPALAVDSSGALQVVWYDHTPDNMEIYHKKSTDGGLNWGASQRITWTEGDSYHPVIAADAGGNLHVVWYDEAPGYSDLYYKSSADGGASWSSAQRITWTSGLSRYPAMAVDSGNAIHIVWEDDTPGNGEIYYKKGS